MKQWFVLIAAVLLYLCAVYVWPTRYRHAHAFKPYFDVRIDRFSQQAEGLTVDGWERLPMNAEEAAKIRSEREDDATLDSISAALAYGDTAEARRIASRIPGLRNRWPSAVH